MPKISVVLPVYNSNEVHLTECLKSIQDQTFTDWECLVVNDGAPLVGQPQTLIANDSRFVELRDHQGRGLASALNFGIDRATGKYIARMDSDDICSVDRFQVQITALDGDLSLAAVGSSIILINQWGQLTGYLDYPITKEAINRRFLYRNAFSHPTIMMRRSLLDDIGAYCEDFYQCEDLELWLRARSKKKKMLNLQSYLLSYRVQDEYERPQANWKFNLKARVRHFRSNNLSDYFAVFFSFVNMIAPSFVRRRMFKFLVRR
ncbi:MAG: glycosyltransferase [Betaproteobacteria bacterium]